MSGTTCVTEMGEEAAAPLPCIHPLQDIHAVLRGSTQQLLHSLWLFDVKTLEEGALEVLNKEGESQEALENQNQRRAAMHVCAHALAAPPCMSTATCHRAHTRLVSTSNCLRAHCPPPPPCAPCSVLPSILPRGKFPSFSSPAMTDRHPTSIKYYDPLWAAIAI